MIFRASLAMTLAVLLPMSFAGAETQKPAPAPFSMGNGDSNWIQTEDASRQGKILTFKEVHIEGNGWLVMHPFEDGAPNGDKYVAATYLDSGTNKDVDIEVYRGVSSGEMFVVMLHRDLNENGVFDFVFIDEQNVMDRAVFEGSRMIGHAVPAP
jgi:hypothetical protein